MARTCKPLLRSPSAPHPSIDVQGFRRQGILQPLLTAPIGVYGHPTMSQASFALDRKLALELGHPGGVSW
jgi:hypothetical protein